MFISFAAQSQVIAWAVQEWCMLVYVHTGCHHKIFQKYSFNHFVVETQYTDLSLKLLIPWSILRDKKESKQNFLDVRR